MLFKKILVTLDGSEPAEKALPYAVNIAKLRKSSIVLFSVSLTIFVDRRDRLFTSYLKINTDKLNEAGIKVTASTGYGDVAEEIIKYANSNKIDLIVMATHGYSRAKRWMFGSISQKVLFRTQIPVLFIKPKSAKASGDFSKILVPVDGSPFSESTFPYAEELARKTNREIFLLHICEPPIVPSYGSRPINKTWKKYRDDMWAEMEHQAVSYLKKTMTAMKKRGINVKSRVVKAQSGEVTKNILTISKEENTDLMVMATQGRSGVNRWVYGSVANKMVEEYPNPILLVRPETSIPASPSQNLLDDIWHGYMANKT